MILTREQERVCAGKSSTWRGAPTPSKRVSAPIATWLPNRWTRLHHAKHDLYSVGTEISKRGLYRLRTLSVRCLVLEFVVPPSKVLPPQPFLYRILRCRAPRVCIRTNKWQLRGSNILNNGYLKAQLNTGVVILYAMLPYIWEKQKRWLYHIHLYTPHSPALLAPLTAR